MKLTYSCMTAVFLFFFITGVLRAQDSSFVNSIGMELVKVPPGRFVVGRFQPPYPKPPGEASPADAAYREEHYQLAEKLAKRDTQPGFTVTITDPFYIGKFEVTQAQWTKIMGSNPSVFKGNKVTGHAGEHPVDNVTWEEVQQFLIRLNRREEGRKYRLPTEFEWEYAARAGATGDIAWSAIRQTAQIGTRTTNRVGQKQPNAWGLYDMLGNVWEWVQDYYNEKLFADSIPVKKGKVHVLKGASFVGDVKNATYMTHAAGPGNGWDVGFRVVMETKND